MVDEYDDRVLIGEIYLPIERLVAYYGRRLERRAPAVQLPADPARRGMRATVGAAHRRVRSALPPGAWPNWVLGNHDSPRIASRVGPAQARVAAMLLLTLRGTPTLYYGDEIGMDDVPIPPEPRAGSLARRTCPGCGCGRDPARTPMQWDARAPRRLLHGRAVAAGGDRLATSTSRARGTTRFRC